MDPSGSGALIALRSAAEGLRALGDTPQHRPQSPPRPPRGLWSGSDLFAFRPDVGSLRRSVSPTPGIPRGGACRAVGCVGGAVRGSVAVLGPPGTAPPPLPLCHTRSEEGAARSARTDAGPGKGPGSPIGPTVCVWGRAVWGGWRGGVGGGGTWGSQPQRGRGARARGLPLMSAARINNRRAAGTNSSSVPDPPGAPALLGQSPPPFIPPLPFLPPALSVGWAADCRPGGVGSGCGMRDAGCGRRGAAHRAAEQSQRRADAPPSLQVPPPRLPPPGWVPPVPPPWRRCRPSPQRSQALCPPVPRCWHAVSCPPPPALSCSRRSPRTPPTPPPRGSIRLAPAGLCPRCATRRAVLMGVV